MLFKMRKIKKQYIWYHPIDAFFFNEHKGEYGFFFFR